MTFMVSPVQDLRAFRGGSDFTVSVGGELFRLHKFPLYAKCAYFKVTPTHNNRCNSVVRQPLYSPIAASSVVHRRHDVAARWENGALVTHGEDEASRSAGQTKRLAERQKPLEKKHCEPVNEAAAALAEPNLPSQNLDDQGGGENAPQSPGGPDSIDIDAFPGTGTVWRSNLFCFPEPSTIHRCDKGGSDACFPPRQGFALCADFCYDIPVQITAGNLTPPLDPRLATLRNRFTRRVRTFSLIKS